MKKEDRLEYNRRYYILTKAWKEGYLKEYPFSRRGNRTFLRFKGAVKQDPKLPFDKGIKITRGEFILKFD